MDTNENSNIISYDTTHPSYIFLKKIQDYSPTFLQYYRLWLQTKSEAEHDTDFEKDYEPSYIENVLWSSLEKQRFFKALERCGPYNYEEIQRRVGPTKTVLQVKIYGEYLKAASEIEGINIDSKVIIPFANEMTDQWIKEEEKLAQDLSSFTDQQAQAINMYHTSELHEYVSFRRYAHQIYLKDPHCKQVKINKKKLNKKKKDMDVFSEISDCIDLSGLSTLATKYNKNAVITEETKLILHRLLIQFLKDVIIKAHWLQRRNGNKIYKKCIKITTSTLYTCKIFEKIRL
ncbi:hypothetical protein BJ944DRAFT_58852 [Cunninghamella echinulata]|nr:hypothetical protein BJ944DRAFT_58852 [Cunninghamella echinulata]